MTRAKHHPHSREERLKLKEKFEEVKPVKKPRSIRGKYKDAIKDQETRDELETYN